MKTPKPIPGKRIHPRQPTRVCVSGGQPRQTWPLDLLNNPDASGSPQLSAETGLEITGYLERAWTPSYPHYSSLQTTRSNYQLTWDEFAHILGVSRRSVINWSKGETQIADRHLAHVNQALVLLESCCGPSPQGNRQALFEEAKGACAVELLTAKSYRMALAQLAWMQNQISNL